MDRSAFVRWRAGSCRQGGLCSRPVISVLLLFSVVLSAFLPVVSFAQPAPEPAPAAAVEAMPAWLHALGKTATYEVLASIDAFVIGFWWTGDGATGGAFAVISAVTAAAAYYGHEMAWNYWGPDPTDADPSELGLYKTISYRLVSGLRVLTLSYGLTGNFLVSGTYVAINTVVDSIVYFGNELAWATWGPKVEYLGR